jgi:hypothetical protein
MKRATLIVGAAIAAAAAIPAFANAANLIQNGSFEMSDNGFSETQTPVDWTNIGHIDGVIAYSVFSTPAYAGSYYYDEGGYGDASNAPGDGIEQTVSTVAGQHYTLQFGLTGENSSGVEIADVTIGSQLTQYTLTVNSAFGVFQDPFVTETISYVATGPSTTIAFTTDASSPSLGSNDPLIDGISFGSSTGGGVPEPATWAMMLVGFAAVGYGLRRSRGQKVVAAA